MKTPSKIGPWMDKWVEAVRADKKMGRGTCSNVDECISDEEMKKEWSEEGVTTKREAVKSMRQTHDLWAEQQEMHDNEARAGGWEG